MVCFPSPLWGRPIRLPAYGHRPRDVSGRVSKHRQACPCACCVGGNKPTGVATRGRGSGGGEGEGRKLAMRSGEKE